MDVQSQLVPGMQNLQTLGEDIPSKSFELQAGEDLFRAGQDPGGIYLLEDGCIKLGFRRSIPRGRVPHDEFVTKLVAPGELFALHVLQPLVTAAASTNATTSSEPPAGASASPIPPEPAATQLIGGKAYFAQAARPSRLIHYPRGSFERLIQATPPLVRGFLMQALRDIDQYQTRAEVHHLATVEQKISAELLRLAEIFGVQRSDGVAVNLALTRNEIAQLADTINESMSRYLTRFQNRGWLEVRGREILLKNIEELKALANSP